MRREEHENFVLHILHFPGGPEPLAGGRPRLRFQRLLKQTKICLKLILAYLFYLYSKKKCISFQDFIHL